MKTSWDYINILYCISSFVYTCTRSFDTLKIWVETGGNNFAFIKENSFKNNSFKFPCQFFLNILHIEKKNITKKLINHNIYGLFFRPVDSATSVKNFMHQIVLFFNKFFHNHFELTCREQFQIISQSQKFATNLNFEEQIHLLAKIGY